MPRQVLVEQLLVAGEERTSRRHALVQSREAVLVAQHLAASQLGLRRLHFQDWVEYGDRISTLNDVGSVGHQKFRDDVVLAVILR